MTGVTGVTSNFTIQSKDAYGNNKLASQALDIFKVHAFIPDRDYDTASMPVDGTVTSSGRDAAAGWQDSLGRTCSDYAALPDARRGQCSSGPGCGCGSSTNMAYIGGASAGLSADQVRN